MAGLTVSILRDRIGEVSEKLRREARAHQLDTANRVRDTAKRLAPVRTGFLRDHIVADASRAVGTKPEGFRGIAVISEAPYSVFLEQGTRFMAPRPFLRPAIEAERSGYVNGFSAIGDSL